MMNKEKIIVLGILGRSPVAGVAWQVLHYLEGLKRLGFDVYYIEDTGDWPYDAEKNTVTEDPNYTLRYINDNMKIVDMEDRWAYRSAVDKSIHGISGTNYRRILKEADIIINLTGSTLLKEEHMHIPIRIYLETDPVLPQIEVAKNHQFKIKQLSNHTHLYTFGENLGAPDCKVPLTMFTYYTTRQPVILDWWGIDNISQESTISASNSNHFCTISSWQQLGKDIEWEGEKYYWSKDLEFMKFIELPKLTEQPLELALAFSSVEKGNQIKDMLKSNGWYVSNAFSLSRDIFTYREYIQSARGEFTVAKDQNIRLKSGWFSDRSACFLAAGKPVITQETGFSNLLPVGEGLFGYFTIDEVLAAIDEIKSDNRKHSYAAREIAVEYFEASKIVKRLLEDSGVF